MKANFNYLTMLLCIVASSCSLMGQESEAPTFFKLDYMQVAGGGGWDYVDLERTYWRPMHEERVKAGEILSWTLYRVRFPTGASSEYGYITATEYDDFAMINMRSGRRIMEKLGRSESDMDLIIDKMMNARNMVKSEIWRQRGSIEPVEAPAFIVVNYMKVPPGANREFMDLRLNFMQPIQQAKVDAGKQLGWGLFSLVFPAGSSIGYSYGSVDMYGDFADVTNRSNREIMDAAHPDKNDEWWQDMWSRMGNTKETVSWELWEVIERVDAESLSASE